MGVSVVVTEPVLVEDTQKVFEAVVDGDTVKGVDDSVRVPIMLPLDTTVLVNEVVGPTEFVSDKDTVGEIEGML